jgi:hypothetical protein
MAGKGGHVPSVGFFHHDKPVPQEAAVVAVRKNEFGSVVLLGTGFA